MAYLNDVMYISKLQHYYLIQTLKIFSHMNLDCAQNGESMLQC